MNKKIDELFFTRSIEKRHQAPYIPISRIPLRQGYGTRNLTAAADNAPQVVVKIPKRHGNSKGLNGISNHIDYIGRNGQLEIEDQDGNIYQGKQEHQEITQNLSKLGIPKESKRREAINFVFSMPPQTNPIKLKNAVRNFAQEQFKNHPYYFTLHTDEAHPHVHLCAIIEGKNGQRLNPRKADLMEYRIQFADHLRDQGIQCTATYRIQQGKERKYQNSTIEHLKKRGGNSYVEQAKNSNKNYLTTQNPYLHKTKNSFQIISKNYENIFNIFHKNNLNSETTKMSILIDKLNNNYQKLFPNDNEENIENYNKIINKNNSKLSQNNNQINNKINDDYDIEI